MLTGLLAGAIAALLASLLSLALQSPDAVVFNTLTITIGALVAGVAAGVLRGAMPAQRFALIWGGIFVVLLVAFALAPFDGLLAYGAPLAAVVLAVTGGLAHVFEDRPPGLSRAMLGGAAAGTTLAAVVVGFALAGQGAESGELTLPGQNIGTAAAVGATNTPSRTGGAATGGSAGLPSQITTRDQLKGVAFVVGQGSEATFTVNEKLAQLPLPNDAVMRTNALTGTVHLDGRPSTVEIDLLKLSSDQSRRDNAVRQSLFARNPTARLTIATLPALPERYEAGQVVKGTLTGMLAINGVEKPVSFETESRIDGTTLNVLGRTAFVWSDFNYRTPNTNGVQVQDRVDVQVLIVGRGQQG